MSPAPLRIGDPVQVKDETEQLTLVCLDNGRAWVRDGAGNHLDYPEEDLVRAHSRLYREANAGILRHDPDHPAGSEGGIGRMLFGSPS